MTSKDFIKIFYFVQQAKQLTKEQRWFLLSLMSYQTICGIYKDYEKEKPFRVYQKKFEEYFQVNEKDFINEINVASTLDDYIKADEIDNSNGVGKAFDVTINWNNLEELRISSIPKKNEQQITQETVLKVLQMIQNGTITIK